MSLSMAQACTMILACAARAAAEAPDESSHGSQAYALRGAAATPSESSSRRLAPSSHGYLGNWTSCEPARLLGEWGSSGRVEALFELGGAIVPHIYKSGGSATHTFVRHHGGAFHSTHSGEQYTPVQLTRMFERSSLFKAAVVRDPLEHTLSAFHEVLTRGAHAHPDLRNWKHYAYNTAELSDTLDAMLDGRTAFEGMASASLENAHFRPQAKYLLNREGEKIRLDYIGNTANLTQELEFIFRTPWANVPLKGGPGSMKFLKDPLDLGGDASAAFKLSSRDLARSTVRKICQVYIVDYCCFGFQFPDACSDFSC